MDEHNENDEAPVYGDSEFVSYWSIILGDEGFEEYED